jgi:hypothetical protein
MDAFFDRLRILGFGVACGAAFMLIGLGAARLLNL